VITLFLYGIMVLLLNDNVYSGITELSTKNLP